MGNRVVDHIHVGIFPCGTINITLWVTISNIACQVNQVQTENTKRINYEWPRRNIQVTIEQI